MYEYRFENFYLSSRRTHNVDLFKCDIADFQAIIHEMAGMGYRYIGIEKFSEGFTLCLLIFERKKDEQDQ